MRLLVVDHNAIDPEQRVLYDKLVELGGITLRLVVPSRWFNTYRMATFVPPSESLPYEVFASDVLFPTRTHRLIYLSLAQHLRTFKPDVVYINAEPENLQTFQAARLCALYSTPLVFSSWRNIDHRVEGYPYKLEVLHRWIEQYVLQRAVHGIVFNATAQRIFAGQGYAATTIIPPAVDTRRFTPRTRAREGKAFVAAYVGRLVEGKGVDLLIDALAELPAHVRGVIVGNGPKARDLRERAARRGVAERVEFRDAVVHESVAHLLPSFDVVVLPSRTMAQWREQFGRILVEAMACGVPVIGSTAGEIPEVIGDAGLVFKEGSVEGLRLGLERLLADSSLRGDLIERGLRRVREKFELTQVARRMHRFFLMLGEKAAAR